MIAQRQPVNGLAGITVPGLGRTLVAILGAGLLACVLGLSPLASASVAALLIPAVIAALYPRFAFVMLPFSVAWGSTLAVHAGSATVTCTDGIVLALGTTVAGQAWREVRGHRTSRSRGGGGAVTPGLGAATRRERPTTFFRIDLWPGSLTVLIGAMLLSTVASVSLGQSIDELVKWLEVLVVALTLPVFLERETDLGQVLIAILLAGLSEAALGIVQFALKIGPQSFVIHGEFMRAYGTFGQPNPYAGFMNITLMVGLAWALARRSGTLLLVSGVLALGMVVSFSRSGWAAAVAGGIVLVAICSYRFRRWLGANFAIGIASVALAAFGLFPVSVLARAGRAFGVTTVNFHHYTAANYSEIERAAHWVAGLRMFARHPLVGVGIGNYPVVYPAYHVGHFVLALGHAHDYFINIAAEAGIIGVLAYTVFVVAGFCACMRVLRTGDEGAALVGLVTVAVWVTVTFHNFFDVLYVHEIQIVIGLLMGSLSLVRMRQGAGPGTVGFGDEPHTTGG